MLSEDRQEYERILDEALRSAPYRPELAAVGQRLNAEQLRTMALNATALITAAAATEYQHYAHVRKELSHPAPSAPSSTDASASGERGTGAMGLAATLGEVTETAGAGAFAVVAVLAPVLAGTAAAIFLLVGFILKVLTPEPAFAQTLLTIGWIFSAVTGAALLVAGAGLLLTALRNGSSSFQAGAPGELNAEVARARAAWREALLERGIMPFLREALADPATALTRSSATPATGRMPHLGYTRPGFSSPGDGTTPGSRPSFAGPDFTSPDFGGPAESTPSTGPEQSD
ncbi:hypothetical protein ACIOHS_02205 [Streptomyces sp. NPDC088253]|uniref:hypothetical protein n=1 Tax=Streptomyces sp. NPDC088253 TaxID=3365846 RepID=UPI003823C758